MARKTKVCSYGFRLYLLTPVCSIFAGLPDSFKAAQYHSLHGIIEHIPPCLEVTATSEDGVVMRIQHTTLPFAAVQFHPKSILTSPTHGLAILKNALTFIKCKDDDAEETFDMTIVTEIFEFLDALEILNTHTAQVNVTMYSRVDAFFGFGLELLMSGKLRHLSLKNRHQPHAQYSVSSSVSSVASNAPSSSNVSRMHAEATPAPAKMPSQLLSNPSPPHAPQGMHFFFITVSRCQGADRLPQLINR